MMIRPAKGFALDDGTTFGPDSIVCHLHFAFGVENEEMTYSLSQHAAEHITELVRACRDLIEAITAESDPITLADSVEFAESIMKRTMEGPAWVEPDWPGAKSMSDDLDQMYSS